MRYWVLVCLGFAWFGDCATDALAGEPIQFNRDVRPILSDRCYHCHGPGEEDRQAGLRLDQFDGDEGAQQVIEPGALEDSELWRRINSEDDDVMPPADSSKKPLSDSERDVLRRWIEQGAEYTAFWAFVPPRKAIPPAVKDERWNRQAIDRFVMQRIASEGLQASPRADRRTLIRRLSLDLTGLPPARAEIQEFLDDPRNDAYERLVDRLLAKPQYGEHLARYWLDIVRFADTNGIHHDHYREMSPYRDWVIRSFNDNLPYDRFTTYQLAGDLNEQPTRDQLVASGFNRLHLIIDRGTALPEESYTRNVVDRVTAVGTAFLGLTVQCAVCHDHKYDPLTTRDFYQLFAFFNNLDGDPETGGRQGLDFERGVQPPYISLATDSQQAQLDDLARRIEAAQATVAAKEKAVTELAAEEQAAKQQANEAQAVKQQGQQAGGAAASGDASRLAALTAELEQAKQALAALRSEQRNLELSIPVAMVMKERAEPRPAYVLLRGAYDKPGDPVERDTPKFLPPLQSAGPQKNRMDLARWLVGPDHPLTARVAVNRFWQQLFGVGLVKTAEDFGAQGQWPSHPELLDYLAVSFIESGWDVKGLMRQIVLSETYQQSSAAPASQYQRDPDNRLLARGSRYRLDAEVIRDQVLATSGLMNYAMYGKSVKPPQPAGLWKAVSMPSSYPREYKADTGDEIFRRSLYTFWKRGMPPPQMTILDAPTREACIARRERTNTPLQALLLLNEPEYLKAARHLAQQTVADGALDQNQRLRVLYETITARVPDAPAMETMRDLVADLESMYGAKPALAEQLCQGVPFEQGRTATELATWTMVASTIYNLEITRTRD